MSGTITKICTKCGKKKPIEDFPFRNRAYREAHPDFARNLQCKHCKNKRRRAERKVKPYTSEQELRWRMREKYGLELEEYEARVEKQGGVCAICGQPPLESTGRLSVDHHHETKQNRALLCAKCNI